MSRFPDDSLSPAAPRRRVYSPRLRLGNRIRKSTLAISLGGLSLLLLVSFSVVGQIPMPLDDDDQPSTLGVELPQDRLLSRGIGKAEESLAKGEYTQTLRFLDEVLSGERDYFVEPKQSGEILGLKEKARRLLRDLPTAGRDAYYATYGPAAERLLGSALASGEREQIAEVVQRYFYTPAGYEAAIALAQNDADAGRYLLAALTYQQLLDTPEAIARFDPGLSLRAAACFLAADQGERAEQTLDDLGKRGEYKIEIAGELRKLTAQKSNPEWVRSILGAPLGIGDDALSDWTTYRGNPARNAVTDGGLPHMRIRWDVRLMSHPKFEQALEDYSADLLREGNLTPLANAPLAVGDQVIVRTIHGLLAVDFKTGKRIWQAEPQRVEELDQLAAQANASSNGQRDPEPARIFAERLWEDYLYNTLSSDGQRVFAIRDLTLPTHLDEDVFGGFNRIDASPVATTNRLCAYDLATQGKLVWELDGAAKEGKLSGAFFLGTPLALDDVLYGLVEIKNSVSLYAADAATGQLLWQQQLVNLDTGVALDAKRRLQCSAPSYQAGMLVCPIGSGIAVGVDLAKRSLAWAYRYDRNDRSIDRYSSHENGSQRNAADHWTEPGALISDGRVLLTPPESDFLHCLDLHTGKLIWKKKRNAFIRLACIDSERALLVGTRRLDALKLSDGSRAWKKQLVLPKGVAPTGTGFVSEGRYFVPLSTAEVVAIDLSTGDIVSRAISRDGQLLGNLICHRGSVLSQNGEFLQRFDQIDVLRENAQQVLANRPDDVEALRTLGEVAYNEGRLSEAITLLERAYQGNPASYATREVLVECLTTALDEDFAAYRSRLGLLEQVEDHSPRQRMELLRIQSSGLLAAGELYPAAAACLEMYDLALPGDESFTLKNGRTVLTARWARAQLAEIWSQADDEIKTKLKVAVRQVAPLDAPPDSETLQTFLEYFGSLPGYEPQQMELARQWSAAGLTLRAQQLFLRLAASDEKSIQAEATARIAADLHSAGLHRLALELDEDLLTDFAAEICYDGKTGAELIADWGRTPLPDKSWPAGRVVSTAVADGHASNSGRTLSPMWGMRLERTDSVLGGSQAMFYSRTGEVSVYDSFGDEIFRHQVNQDDVQRFHYRQATSTYAVSRGNVLVSSLGRQLVAFNTLAKSNGSEGYQPSVLWRASLTSDLDANSYPRSSGRASEQRPGSHRAQRSTFEGHWIGVIGPVTDEGCVYQTQRNLVCVDTLDGRELWSRTDVPQGCDLFGDEQFLFAAPRNSHTARVYSMIDGRLLGKAKVPRWNEQLATRGRTIVRWHDERGRQAEERMTLSAIDAKSNETLWSHRFPKNAQVDVDRGRFIAVVTPAGRCVIVDAKGGAVVVDSMLKPSEHLQAVHLVVGTDSFTVVTNAPDKKSGRRSARVVNQVDYDVIDGQAMVFERSTGKPRWQRSAELKQEGWMITQPADLPILVFAANHSRHDQNGGGQGTSLLALDKRTGETLYRADDLPDSGSGYCAARVADEQQHLVTIEMATRTVQLKFTEKPRPPQPPAMAEVETNNVPQTGGLGRIFQKLGAGR